jgi:hypothetical protein
MHTFSTGHNPPNPQQTNPPTVQRRLGRLLVPRRRRRALPRLPQLPPQPLRRLQLVAHLPQGGLQVGHLVLLGLVGGLQRGAAVGGGGGAGGIQLAREVGLAARGLLLGGADLFVERLGVGCRLLVSW